VAIAMSLSRWLTKISATLQERELVFEAAGANSLAIEFETYADDNGTPEGFVRLWNDLSDWAETAVVSGRREKSLCELPPLPERLEC
jgi:hypothetical protein